MNTAAITKTKVRLTLLALLAVFLMPLLLAWLFARGPLDWQPQSTLNFGVLLEPPLPLKSYGVTDASGAALNLTAAARDWFLVVLHAAACTERCQQLMQNAERIQLGVGDDAYRVNLALLSAIEDAPTLMGYRWRLPADNELFQELRLASGEEQLDTILLIVDYRGHVVLMYPPDEDGPGVLEDLKRLLRAAAT